MYMSNAFKENNDNKIINMLDVFLFVIGMYKIMRYFLIQCIE